MPIKDDKTQTPPGTLGSVNYFESFNKENEKKPMVDWNAMSYQPNLPSAPDVNTYIPTPLAPLPDGLNTPTAQSAYQQSFPQPKDSVQQSAENAVKVPQLANPNEYLYKEVRTDNTPAQPEFNADEYKDGTADGLGRNFLKTFTIPKTERDYSKENENKKRILALGNALRHIGNIVYTSKGAPAQIFNDPVAMQEQKYQNEKTKRETTAYREAQRQYQQDKLQGDQDYKKFLLNLRMGDLDRQNRRDQAAIERNKKMDEALNQNRADRLKLQQDQLDYRKQNDQANRDLRKELANQSAALRLQLKSMGGGKGSSGGSGSGGKGGKHVLGSARGYFTSSRNLNDAEWKQIYGELKDHLKVLTPAKQKQIEAAYKVSETAGNALVKEAAGWTAMRDGRTTGDAFRNFLTNTIGLGYVPTDANNITVRSKGQTKAVQKKVVTPSSTKVVKQAKATQNGGGKNNDKDAIRRKNNGAGL